MATFPRDVLISFLEVMDSTQETPCLKSTDAREWLETDVWELQYRLDQVAYHNDRLLNMLQEELVSSASLPATSQPHEVKELADELDV